MFDRLYCILLNLLRHAKSIISHIILILFSILKYHYRTNPINKFRDNLTTVIFIFFLKCSVNVTLHSVGVMGII